MLYQLTKAHTADTFRTAELRFYYMDQLERLPLIAVVVNYCNELQLLFIPNLLCGKWGFVL